MKYQVSFLCENLISSHVKITCYLHMGKYYLCCGYIINRAFHTLRSHVKYFSKLEEKFRISAQPCNILYLQLWLFIPKVLKHAPMNKYPLKKCTLHAFIPKNLQKFPSENVIIGGWGTWGMGYVGEGGIGGWGWGRGGIGGWGWGRGGGGVISKME